MPRSHGLRHIWQERRRLHERMFENLLCIRRPNCNHHNVKCEVSCCSSDYCNGNLPLTSIPTTPLPRPKPPEPVTSHVCYQCLSRHSFENCDRRRFTVKCKNWQPCVKASSEEYYFKGCTTTCVASTIWICNLRNVDCRVHCCYSDLCNDASIPNDSGLILVVIVSFMYFSDSRLCLFDIQE